VTLPFALSPAAEDDLVLFRIEEKRIEVIAVWHGHRDPKGWQARESRAQRAEGEQSS